MGKIENPTLKEMKVIVECEANGICMDNEYDVFDASEIDELAYYLLDEDINGISNDTTMTLSDEFGDVTGIQTDILHQAKIIVNEIDNLKIYKQAKLLIEICKKHGVNELNYIER